MARRGGQKGNKNARTHGLLSGLFTEADLKNIMELADKPKAELVGEIAVLRYAYQKAASVVLRRRERGEAPVDPLIGLDVLSQAGHRLAGMMKAERVLAGEGTESLSAAMAVALREIGEELGIGDAGTG